MAWIVLIAVFSCLDRLGFQHGLRGEYYQNVKWQGAAAFEEIESSINLNAARKRILSFSQEFYSAKWTGWLFVETPGDYTFQVRADDNANMSIDGQLLIDTQSVQTFQPASQKIVLPKGLHRVEVKYIQQAGSCGLRVSWTKPDGKEERLPANMLFPNKPSPQRLLMEQILRHALPVTLLAFIAWSLFTLASCRKQVIWFFSASKRLIEQLSENVCLRILQIPRFRYAVFAVIVLCIIFLLVKDQFMPIHGLVASYYDTPKWQGKPLFSEITPSLSLDMENWHGFPQRYYSVQWKGWLYVEQDGDYALFANADDGVAVWLNDVMLIDARQKEAWWPLLLRKGFYAITIRYYQEKYEYALAVGWQRSGGKREAFPLQWCFPEKPADDSFLWKKRISDGLAYIAWGVLLWAGIVLSVGQRTLWEALARKLFHESRLGYMLRKLTRRCRYITNRQVVVIHVLILFVLGSAIGFHRLGEKSLGERIGGTWSWDEVVHTLVAQRIAETGDWFHLEYQGKPYYNKPPLKIWLNAMTFALFGDSEFWIRCWSVVFGLAAILTTYFLGKALTNSSTVGLIGACILLGSPFYIFLHNMRDGVQDSGVELFFLLALLAFWRRIEHPRYYYFAGLCMGIGALIKSVNGLLPAGIIILYLLATKSWSEFKNFRLYGMLLLAIFLPGLWFGAHSILSPGFFERAIHQEIFARAAVTSPDKNIGVGHHIFGPSYYLWSLLQGLYPWGYFYVPALLLGTWRAFSKHQSDLFLVIWTLFILVGFSVPGYKSHWYIYYIYPSLALLIAELVIALVALSRKFHQAHPLFSVLVPAALVGLLCFSLSANFARTYQNPKIPIHRLVEYLKQRNEPYQVVAYQLPDAPFMERPRYYLNKLASQLVSVNKIDDLQTIVRSGTPVFVVIQPKQAEIEPFFQEAPYWYLMHDKTGDAALDSGNHAALELLVYNDHLDDTLLLQQISTKQ